MSHHILDGFHVLTDFFCRSDSKNNDEISINLYEEKKNWTEKENWKKKWRTFIEQIIDKLNDFTRCVGLVRSLEMLYNHAIIGVHVFVASRLKSI